VGKSQHSTTLSVHASKRLIIVIEERARALGISKSRFASLILDKWAETGYLPINEPDRLLQIAAKSLSGGQKRK